MQFKGIVKHKSDVIVMNENFSKIVLVLEQEGDEKYPQSISIDYTNKAMPNVEKIACGDLVEASLQFSCKEYNGKFYTAIKGWKVEKLDNGGLQFGGGKEEDFEQLPF